MRSWIRTCVLVLKGLLLSQVSGILQQLRQAYCKEGRSSFCVYNTMNLKIILLLNFFDFIKFHLKTSHVNAEKRTTIL
jgi:hypothetical protein